VVEMEKRTKIATKIENNFSETREDMAEPFQRELVIAEVQF
jgi:hypothetical protein